MSSGLGFSTSMTFKKAFMTFFSSEVRKLFSSLFGDSCGAPYEGTIKQISTDKVG